MAHLLRITLTPDGAPPFEAWAFEVAGTSRGGWLTGSLPQEAHSALSLAWASRRAGIVLTLPCAGRFGLLASRFVIVDPQDTHQQLRVDVDRLSGGRRRVEGCALAAGGANGGCHRRKSRHLYATGCAVSSIDATLI